MITQVKLRWDKLIIEKNIKEEIVMKRIIFLSAIIYTGLILTGCSENGPGYLFQLIFIVAPIIGLGFMLLKRTESTNDSLYILEGQIKRLSAKLENLEEKVSELGEKENKPKGKK